MTNITDLRDLALLSDLVNGEHRSKMTGITIKQFKLDRTASAIHRRLQYLESKGFVCRGFRLANADTYYVTPEGINFYMEAVD